MTEHAGDVVYRVYDEDDELLYVGMSSRVYYRLRSHESTQWWWGLAATVSIRRYSDRQAARSAEIWAIRTERPVFNIAGKHRTDWRKAQLLACDHESLRRAIA